MGVVGTVLKNRRAGEARLAWNLPGLDGPVTLEVTSEAFGDGAAIPVEHAGKRAGGRNISPPLSWTAPPPGTADLLLVIEDIDVPMRSPFVHCVALIPADAGSLAAGGLAAADPAPGVRVLRSGLGRGYLGPEPIKGHGPHRYVFQLFAVAKPVAIGPDGAVLESAKPRDVLAAAGPVTVRGRLDGFYERT